METGLIKYFFINYKLERRMERTLLSGSWTDERVLY